MENLNGYDPKNEEECWAMDLAWALAQQGEQLDKERRVQWLRTGFCTQHELNRIQHHLNRFRGQLGGLAIEGDQTSLEDFEGWHGLD